LTGRKAKKFIGDNQKNHESYGPLPIKPSLARLPDSGKDTKTDQANNRKEIKAIISVEMTLQGSSRKRRRADKICRPFLSAPTKSRTPAPSSATPSGDNLFGLSASAPDPISASSRILTFF